MSAYIDYNSDLLEVRRITTMSAYLSDFTVGVSTLAATATESVVVDGATVAITSTYSPDENGTLIVDAETAIVSRSYWGTAGLSGEILYPGDRLEVFYDSELIFWGTVDTASLTYATDPEAARHGQVRRVDFTASAAGVYAVAMGRIVSWSKIPKETAITRIRRWCTVVGF